MMPSQRVASRNTANFSAAAPFVAIALGVALVFAPMSARADL
jgi:hypothetical protein